jgi:hypothetical protein
VLTASSSLIGQLAGAHQSGSTQVSSRLKALQQFVQSCPVSVNQDAQGESFGFQELCLPFEFELTAAALYFVA